VRNAFIEELTLLAEEDDKIFLIIGDLGFGVIENFEKRFPNQFLNAGVAEQNMMGMAAGLASTGYKVYVYSIGNFPVFRCLEQIRNDICYQELDVSIVSIGAGLSYGTLGYSHHAIDDIGVMSALPGMTIYSPADAIETRRALRESISIQTPKYFRLGKSGEPEIFNQTPTEFPNWTELTNGNDLLVLTTGAITNEAIEAAAVLRNLEIEIAVVAIPVLKPLAFDKDLVGRFNNVLVLEEHSELGGLGTIISEKLALSGLKANIVKLGLADQVHHEIGSQKYLRHYFKMDAGGIVEKVKQILGD
jgi:transketolase